MAEARRKTTLEERKEIVDYCINHNRNYKNTAAKFDVSYSQVYSWVKKYDQWIARKADSYICNTVDAWEHFPAALYRCPIYPHENSTGIYRTEKISSILIYTFLYLMFHDFPTLLHFSCKFQTVIPIDRRIRIGNDIQHFLINNEHSVNGNDIPA